ncbi:MAG: helix-turn-helix domain-containing protein [Planctomycetes bacterium]|nr:helix-turn-helix domain-containing protein [Planctomycetota bacterium]
MKLIGTHEVLEILGIKLPTLYAWVQRGKLHPQKVGKLLKFDEAEVRGVIQPRSVFAWLITGPVETAISSARRLLDTVPPDYRLIYLEPPEPGRAHVRVQAFDVQTASWVEPWLTQGSPTLRAMQGAAEGRGFLFLRTPEPWRVLEIRPEEIGDRSYLTLFIERIRKPGTGDLSEALERLEKGFIQGEARPWSREELHDRGRR